MNKCKCGGEPIIIYFDQTTLLVECSECKNLGDIPIHPAAIIWRKKNKQHPINNPPQALDK